MSDHYRYSDNYAKPRQPLHTEVAAATEHQHHDHSAMPGYVAAESNSREYKKLAGIIGVIFACATIMSFVLGFDWAEWFRWFMGGFFVFFGSFKLIGYEMFIMMFPTYDIIAKRFKYYAFAYPFVQLFLGFLYVADLASLFRDSITLIIMGVGAYGILKHSPKNGEAIRCACLGNVIKLPLSTVTLLEDATMAVMAAIMLLGQLLS